jgi:hypothetical protein
MAMGTEEITTILSLTLSGVIVYTYSSLRNAQRIKSRFNMFAVRDNLVLLVAKGHLQEDSPVFNYFYQRINRILSDNKPMVYHDLLLAIAYINTDRSNLRKAIAESFQQSQKILAMEEAKTPETRKVIDAYYAGVSKILLAHSNFLRFAYLASKLITVSVVKRFLRAVVSRDIDAGLVIIRQSKKASHQLDANLNTA